MELPVQIHTGHLAEMLKLIENNTISGKIAKTVFEEMFATGKMPGAIVKDKGLVQITDENQLEEMIETILADNPGPAAQYQAGKNDCQSITAAR